MRSFLLLGLGGLLVCVLGCALPSPALTPGDAVSIEPLDYTLGTGTLIAHVEGFPREIEYYINGVRIEPDKEIEWWKDAELRLELKPGTYHVSATFVARGFAPDRKEFQIETERPVQVRAGFETQLRAVIRKDWRGIPENDVTPFEVVVPGQKPASAGGAAAAAAAPAVEAAAAADGADAATDAAAATEYHGDVTVIRGSRDGQPEISHVGGPEPAASDSGEIVIRGTDVVSQAPESSAAEGAAAESAPAAPGETAAAASGESAVPAGETAAAGGETAAPGGETAAAVGTASVVTGNSASPGEGPAAAADGASPAATSASAAEEVGLPAIETPANEDIPPPAAAEPAPVVVGAAASSQARVPWVTVQLQSEPAGAQVVVDDQAVGQTPVRVRLDASADHVVQFSRDGCSEHVRFLSAAGWEKGRSTTVRVQLECP